MSELLVGRILVFILGVAWTVIFFLGKRTLYSIDGKIDGNIEKIERSYRSLKTTMKRRDIHILREFRLLTRDTQKYKAKLEQRMEGQGKAYQRFFVSRQEFGAFTASINHKIDSIYEILKKEGAKAL